MRCFFMPEINPKHKKTAFLIEKRFLNKPVKLAN